MRLFGGLLAPGCNFLPPGMVGYTKIDPVPVGRPERRSRPREGSLPDQGGRRRGREGHGLGRRRGALQEDDRGLHGRPEQDRPQGDAARSSAAETYFATIGDRKLNAQTGFDNWFQDFPHPADFFFLVERGSIQPTNNQNHSLVDDPKVDKLAAEIKEPRRPRTVPTSRRSSTSTSTGPDAAYITAYGHSKDTTFVSERMDFKNCTVYHPVYRDDWSQLLPQVGTLVIGPPRPRAGAVGHGNPQRVNVD